MSDEQAPPSATPARLLGELEAAIMRVIWQHGEQRVRDVWLRLQAERPLAYTTVLTVMSRLAEKGLLLVRKDGPAYHYRAAMPPQEFVTRRAEAAVQQVLADFGDLALAAFVRALDEVDPARLERLRQMADLEAQQTSGEEHAS